MTIVVRSTGLGATVTYDEFLPEVTPFVDNVPEFVASNAVRNACIEFCEKTRYWQQELLPFNSVVGQPNYAIATPGDTIFVDAMETWCDGNLLIPKAPEELTRIFRTMDWRSQPGNPIYISRIIQSEVLLVPVPQMVNIITMRIALAPSRASTTVNSEIFQHYAEYIAFGARARLYDTPNQPYFDRAAADVYERKFRSAISEVRLKVNKGMSRASVAVEFQRFA